MATSNNYISGINNYKINSFGELKIDISILYFLEGELCCFFDFYRLNENKYDLFLKIEYTFINDYIENKKIYYEKYYFFIRNKIDEKLIFKIDYNTLYPDQNCLIFYYIKEYIIPFYKNIMYYFKEELPIIKKNLTEQLCKKYLNDDIKTIIEKYLNNNEYNKYNFLSSDEEDNDEEDNDEEDNLFF